MPLSGCAAGSPSDGHPTGKALLPAFPELAPLPWAESRCGLVTCSCGRRWAPARGPTEACPPVPRGFPGTRGLNPKCLLLRPLSLNSAHPHMPRRTLRCSAGSWCGLTRPSLCVSQAVCMLSSPSARLSWRLSGSVMRFSALSAGILSAQNRTGCIYLGAPFVPCGSPGKQTPVLRRRAAVALAHHCGAH